MIGLDISVKDSSKEERLTALDRMPTSWLESVGTAFDLGNENAPTKSIQRAIKRSYAEYLKWIKRYCTLINERKNLINYLET